MEIDEEKSITQHEKKHSVVSDVGGGVGYGVSSKWNGFFIDCNSTNSAN